MTDSTPAESRPAEAPGTAEVRKRSALKRLLPLLVLLVATVAVLALLPVAYRKYKARSTDPATGR